MTLLISRCHHSYYLRILIKASAAHVYAVGVTNRRDQQKARFIALRGPLWTALTHIHTFVSIFDATAIISTRKFAYNSGYGDFRADNNNDNRTDYFTPLCMRTGCMRKGSMGHNLPNNSM